MAEVTLHPDSQQFPPGTKLKVYLRERPEAGGNVSGAPAGSVLSEPEVSESGALVVTALQEGEEYIAWVAAPDRYLRFQAGGTQGGLAFLGGDGTVGGAGGSPLSSSLVKRPILYGPSGLRRFRALAGDALFKVVPIVCVGDSITAGQGGDNNTGTFNNVPDNTQGWVGQLRQMLAVSPQTLASNPGEGFWFSDESRLTTAEAPADNNYACTPLHKGYRLLNHAPKQAIKLAAIPAGVTKIGIIQANMDKAFNEAGTKLADVTGFYKLGAGAETALTALTNTRIPLETQITVVAGEELQILGPATAQTYITGIVMYTGNNGIIVHRIGQAGFVSGDALGGQKLGVLTASAENQVAATRALYRWAGTAGLLVLSFGVNDQQFQSAGGSEAQRGVSLARYTEWMKQVSNQAIADGWCVLILGEPRSPSEASGETVATADEYWTAMREYASETEHASFMDVGELWGSHTAAEALGLTAAGTVHPLRPGHGDIAQMVYRVILGNAPAGVAAPQAA